MTLAGAVSLTLGIVTLVYGVQTWWVALIGVSLVGTGAGILAGRIDSQ